MILVLERDDLLFAHRDINCSATNFQHFKPEVQTAIEAVGKATFYTNRGTTQENYNVIYPPRKQS